MKSENSKHKTKNMKGTWQFWYLIKDYTYMWLFLVLQLSCFSVKLFAIVFVARLTILDYYSLYCWKGWEYLWIDWVDKKFLKKIWEREVLNIFQDDEMIWSNIEQIESETKWRNSYFECIWVGWVYKKKKVERLGKRRVLNTLWDSKVRWSE